MRSVVVLAAGLSLALAAPALAQSSQSGSGSQSPGQSPIQVPATGSGHAATESGSQSTNHSAQSQASNQQGSAGMQSGSQSWSNGAQASNQQGSQGANQNGNTRVVAQRMKQELEQAGFTDVTIVPESFLVRAHDKEGRPVVMMVNPHSVLAVTKLGGPSKMANSANSGGSGNGASNYQ